MTARKNRWKFAASDTEQLGLVKMFFQNLNKYVFEILTFVTAFWRLTVGIKEMKLERIRTGMGKAR